MRSRFSCCHSTVVTGGAIPEYCHVVHTGHLLPVACRVAILAVVGSTYMTGRHMFAFHPRRAFVATGTAGRGALENTVGMAGTAVGRLMSAIEWKAGGQMVETGILCEGTCRSEKCHDECQCKQNPSQQAIVPDGSQQAVTTVAQVGVTS